MKALICVVAAGLLATPPALALAAAVKAPVAKTPAAKSPPVTSRHHRTKHAAKSADQVFASGDCKVTIPRSWSNLRGAMVDPKDPVFNVTVGAAADPKSVAAAVKAMHGRTLSSTREMTLLQVPLRGRDATQYWALTKPGPGCRATVTFSGPDQEAARKIAESLKKGR